MTSTLRPLTLLAVPFLLLACGGPSVQYDAAPAPAWTAEPPADVAARTLTAVGGAPATLDAARDRDLATRDAKSKIAQLFNSQVVSRTSDWSLASTGGAADGERQVAATSVEVRSNVNVEDVSVSGGYRDEATKTQFVRITVDRAAWARRLRGRLADGLEQVAAKVSHARQSVESSQPLVAHTALLEAAALGRAVEPDIVVIDLLAQGSGVRQKLMGHKEAIDGLSRELRAKHKVAVNVSCKNRAAAEQLRRNLTEFFGAYGFTVAGKIGGPAIRIEAKLGERRVTTEKVAGRTEYVHGGSATLTVKDGDGSTVAELAVSFSPDRYTERDVDAAAAGQKAFMLAADTAASKLRSAWRKHFAEE